MLLQELVGSEIGVPRKDDDRSGAEGRGEDGVDGGQAGGEDTGLGFGMFKLGDGPLEVGPGGVVGAGVAVFRQVGIAWGVEGGGEDGAGVERRAGLGSGEGGAEELSGRVHG
jgi:hypothetical protein